MPEVERSANEGGSQKLPQHGARTGIGIKQEKAEVTHVKDLRFVSNFGRLWPEITAACLTRLPECSDNGATVVPLLVCSEVSGNAGF